MNVLLADTSNTAIISDPTTLQTVATLLCEDIQKTDNNISQGSVATRLRWDGIFNEGPAVLLGATYSVNFF